MEARLLSSKKCFICFYMLYTPHSLSFNSFTASSLNRIYLPRPDTLWLQSLALGQGCSHLKSIHIGSVSAAFHLTYSATFEDLTARTGASRFIFATHPSLASHKFLWWHGSTVCGYLSQTYLLVLEKMTALTDFDSLLTNTVGTQNKSHHYKSNYVCK